VKVFIETFFPNTPPKSTACPFITSCIAAQRLASGISAFFAAVAKVFVLNTLIGIDSPSGKNVPLGGIEIKGSNLRRGPAAVRVMGFMVNESST
jgi:hypothetical protein